MDTRPRESNLDTGLLCLTIIARLHHLPADPKQLLHEFGDIDKPFDSSDIQRAAKRLGLKSRSFRSDWTTLATAHFPCIAEIAPHQFVLIGGLKDDEILIRDQLLEALASMSRAQFECQWSGEVILVTRRAGLAASLDKFGLLWFIPSIAKYKRYLGDVLIASFFLQLFALVTPLFFRLSSIRS